MSGHFPETWRYHQELNGPWGDVIMSLYCLSALPAAYGSSDGAGPTHWSRVINSIYIVSATLVFFLCCWGWRFSSAVIMVFWSLRQWLPFVKAYWFLNVFSCYCRRGLFDHYMRRVLCWWLRSLITARKSGTEVPGARYMKPPECGSTLTLNLAPRWGFHLLFWICLRNVWTTGLPFKLMYICRLNCNDFNDSLIISSRQSLNFVQYFCVECSVRLSSWKKQPLSSSVQLLIMTPKHRLYTKLCFCTKTKAK